MNIKDTILESFTGQYCFQIKNRIKDGAGGFIVTYSDGLEFTAVLRHENTIEAQIAEKEDSASTYTFFVDKDMDIDFHEIFKRLKDGVFFQVTDPEGHSTPNISKLGLKSIKCRKWTMTS